MTIAGPRCIPLYRPCLLRVLDTFSLPVTPQDLSLPAERNNGAGSGRGAGPTVPLLPMRWDEGGKRAEGWENNRLAALPFGLGLAIMGYTCALASDVYGSGLRPSVFCCPWSVLERLIMCSTSVLLNGK